MWQSDAPRTQLDATRRLRDLDPELRQAILWIKDVWSGRPEYPEQIGGVDIYVAVVEHGARTPADFLAHLEGLSSAAERGRPPEGRSRRAAGSRHPGPRAVPGASPPPGDHR
ncbi:hypothetical protein [Sorangium sp. So ce1151]|uniref:hypothetical protein n=1 Tax=Sorangium sp. So ce1151 TaxID=3133332 RepID=UPI003F645EA0